MRTPFVLLAAFVILPIFVPLTRADDFTGCRAFTDKSVIEVDGFYIQGTAHAISQESNGIPGLQRFFTFCDDGRVYWPDTCIVYSGDDPIGTAECALAYVETHS